MNNRIKNGEKTRKAIYRKPLKELLITEYVSYLFFAVVFLGVARLLLQVCLYYFDTDTYFIITTGRYILKNGLPEFNPFVIHDGLKMVVHQWLYDVIVAFCYEHFGKIGLAFFCGVLSGGIFFCVYKLSKMYCSAKIPSLIVASVTIFFLSPFLTLRPTIVSILFVLLELLCFKRYSDTRKLFYLLPTLAISVLWANIHTSMWVFCIVMVLPNIIPKTFRFEQLKKGFVKNYFEDKKWIFADLFLMTLCGLINPYGIKGMLYPIKSLGLISGLSILELQAPAIKSIAGFFIVGSLLVIIATLVKNKTKIDTDLLVLFFGTLILAVFYTRNMWMLVLGFLPVLCVSFSTYYSTFKVKLSAYINTYSDEQKKQYKKNRLIDKITLCTVVLIVLVSFAAVRPDKEYKTTDIGGIPSVVEYLNENANPDAKLYVGFNYGAYMQFNGYKTYFDARPEIYSSTFTEGKDILEEYKRVLSGDIDYPEWIKQYDFDYMVVYENNLKQYLKYCKEYDKVLTDGNCILYKRH